MNGDVGGRVVYYFEADLNDLQKGIQKAEELFGNVNKAAAKTSSQMEEEFKNGASGVTKSFSAIVNAATEAFSSVGKTLGSIAWDTATSGAAALAGSFVGMSKGAVSDTSALENIQIQMTGLTHSTELANKAMADSVKYFKNNPFNRFDVTNATKNFIQFGGDVNEVSSFLNKMGKVSLSTGAKIDELAYAYQRSASDGKVSLIDLQILANKGVPIWDALAKAAGMSSAEVRAATRSGGLAVEDFKKAFDYLVDDNAMELFNNTFSRQVDRFKGRISNMKAAIAGYSVSPTEGLIIANDGLYRSVVRLTKAFADAMDSDAGKKLYDAFGRLGNAVAPLINKLAEKMPAMIEKAAKALSFLADNSKLLIPIFAGAGIAFGNMASGLPVIGGQVGKVTGGFKKFWSVLKGNPLTTVVTLLGAKGLMGALKDPAGQTALKSIIDSVGKIFSALSKVIPQLFSISEKVLTPVFVTILQVVANVLGVIADVLTKIPTEVLTALVMAIGAFAAYKKVSGILSDTAKSMSKLTNAAKGAGGAGGSAGETIGNFAAGALKPLGNPEVLKGAAAVAVVSAGLLMLAGAFAIMNQTPVNAGNMLAFGAVVLVAIGICLALGALAPVAAAAVVGALALASVGAGIGIAAGGIALASIAASAIDLTALTNLLSAILIVSLMTAPMLLILPFAAVSTAFGAIMGVGLALTAGGLALTSMLAKNIDLESIKNLAQAIAEIAGMLGPMVIAAAFGAIVTTVAVVMGVGLLATAAGLLAASLIAQNIDWDSLSLFCEKFSGLAWSMAGLIIAVPLGIVATTLGMVLGVGLLGTTAALMGASKFAEKISWDALDKFCEKYTGLSWTLFGISFISGMALIGAVAAAAVGIALEKAARAIQLTSTLASAINWNAIQSLTDNFDKVKDALNKAKEWPIDAAKRMTEVSTLLLAGGIRFSIAMKFFDGINTEGLVDKMNDIEKAISRDGQGWPIWWAEQFSAYIRKLTGEGNLSLVKDFINTVINWPTDKLFEHLNNFEKAVSRDGNGWPIWWAEQFGDYIKKLTGEGKLDLVKDFINAVIGWPTDKLFGHLNDFEKAISRDGAGWNKYWAETFGEYVKKLTGDGNLNMVKDFINTVIGWNTKKLQIQLNDFEKAISRDGAGWDKYWADRFKEYIEHIAANGNLNTVKEFINSVVSWPTEKLLRQFNDFERAVSRNGDGWPKDWAIGFKNYIMELSAEGNLELVKSFIDAVVGWPTDKLYQNLFDFEKAISQDGKGWPKDWATGFKNYIDELAGEGKIDLVATFIDKVLAWNTKELTTKLDEFSKSISAINWGEKQEEAKGFKQYIDELVGEGKIDLIVTFIDKIMGWKTNELGTKLNEFATAIDSIDWSSKEEKAKSFNTYIKNLAGDGTSIDFLSAFIDKIINLKTKEFGENLTSFITSIESHDWKSNLEKSENFSKYMKYLGEITSLDAVINLIEKFNSLKLEGENINNAFKALKSIVDGGDEGWNLDNAVNFVSVMEEIMKLGTDFSSVTNLVNAFVGLKDADIGNSASALQEIISSIKTSFETLSSDLYTEGQSAYNQWVNGFNDNLVSLGASDFEAFTNTFYSHFSTLSDDLYTEGQTSYNMWSNGFNDNLVTYGYDDMMAFTDTIYSHFSTLSNDLYTEGQTAYNQFVQGMLNNLEIETASFIQHFASTMTSAYNSSVSLLNDLGRGVAIAMMYGAMNQIPYELQLFSTTLVDSMYRAYNSVVPEFNNIGKGIAISLFYGLINETQNNAGKIIGEFSEKITWPIHNTYQKTYNDAGWAIAAGLAWGMTNGTSLIYEAIGGLSGAAVNKLKDLLGIASPSKVFFGLGKNIGEGLANGIESMIDTVARQTENLVSAVNYEMTELGAPMINGSAGGNTTNNKTNNITNNNYFNNGLDISAAMSQLMWETQRL